MPREYVSFQTDDNVTLRAWFFKPDNAGSKPLPCLIMCHGWSVVKEMGLDTYAEHFVSQLPMSVLAYDHRGFGDSDTKEGAPRNEILPTQQTSDFSHAITYTQSRSDVDMNKIGIWGSSYSGGHSLWVGATDRRVKLVLCQVPMVDGWAVFHRLNRPDRIPDINAKFQDDRLARAAGKLPATIPIIQADPTKPQVFPTSDSYEFFSSWEEKLPTGKWKNEVTVRSLEALREYYPSAHIHHISPTPLLMIVAEDDVLTPPDLALEAFERARQPKELTIVPGGHFDGYAGKAFERNAGKQVEFLRKYWFAS